MLVVAAILNIAGLAQLPKTMPFDQAPPSSSTRLRLVAAFLVILLVSFNLMVRSLFVDCSTDLQGPRRSACARSPLLLSLRSAHVPYSLGTGIFHRPRLPSFLLLASINFLIVPPALYLFIVVAVRPRQAYRWRQVQAQLSHRSRTIRRRYCRTTSSFSTSHLASSKASTASFSPSSISNSSS